MPLLDWGEEASFNNISLWCSCCRAWLGQAEDGKLAITSTPNQDNPLMKDVVDCPCTPLLGLDVWEHGMGTPAALRPAACAPACSPALPSH